jgi:SET domain-containing protein
MTPLPTPSNSMGDIVLRSPETVGIFIQVHESDGKGYGVFALRDLLAGSIILSEAPLVTLIDTGTRTDPLDIAVDALPPMQRKAYQSLHSFRRNQSESLNRSILYSNGFATGELISGVFEIASRINHSCVPNSEFIWEEKEGRLVFVNRFKLLEGEEVTVDYGHKKKNLAKFYGFVCDCDGCTDSELSSVESSMGSEVGQDENMPSIDSLILENSRK